MSASLGRVRRAMFIVIALVIAGVFIVLEGIGYLLGDQVANRLARTIRGPWGIVTALAVPVITIAILLYLEARKS